MQEEMPEVDTLAREACPHDVKSVESKHGKANVLIQVCGAIQAFPAELKEPQAEACQGKCVHSGAGKCHASA